MTEPVKQYVELATICWRQGRAANKLDKTNGDVQRLGREVDRFGRVLSTLEIEINDYEGRKNNNLNVETASIEVDESVSDEIIFETITPEIKYKGELQRKSRVVVHKPAEGSVSTADSKPLVEDTGTSPIDSFHENAGENQSADTKKKFIPINPAIVAWLAVLSCAIILLGILSFTSDIDYNDSIISGLNRVISEKNVTIEDQQNRIDLLEKDNAKLKADIANLKESTSQKPDGESGVPGTNVTLRRYVVQSGDTLSSICVEHGLDYDEYERIIIGINGITNPNEIDIGQILFLPSS